MEFMPERVFRRWLAFYRTNPFGPRQEDRRAGTLAELLHWAHRGRDARALRAEDFFPSLEEQKPEREQTQEKIHSGMERWAQAWGAAIAQGKRK